MFAAELPVDDEQVLELIREDRSLEYIAGRFRVPLKLLCIKWEIMQHHYDNIGEFVFPVNGDFLKDEEIPPNFDEHIC